ncbi:MAG: AraC family transcriptional regulator [Akkermansiaceae bacterium]|nr:AraC family transcriptional regulator [Akkermansiaceae bacterium]
MPKMNHHSPAGAKAKGFPILMPEDPQSGTEPEHNGTPADLRHHLLRHLDRNLLTRFEEVTGHRLHLRWHEPREFHDPAKPPLLCPKARARLASGLPLRSECAVCQRDHWRPLAPATGLGRRVRGACGDHGFWAMVRAGPERPLTLALHAVTLSPHFMEAVQLLLLVLRKVETGLAAAQAARALEQALSLPSPPAADPGPAISHPAHAHAHGPRAAAIVHAMLGQVRDHYQRPLDLSHLAEALGRNPSYLSTVFAAHMGVPFHRYLCEFRLIKAMELLRDPLRLISDISAATGHASPNPSGSEDPKNREVFWEICNCGDPRFWTRLR